MWLPKWLGRNYAKLYSCFKLDLFDFKKVCEALGMDEQKARLVLSRLKRAGYLTVFSKAGRKRIYRLLDPSLAVYAIGSGLEGYAEVQGSYVRLILLFIRKIFEKYGGNVFSIVLYGSVARRRAEKNSDVDLLLIIDGLPLSYSKRIEDLVSLEFDESIRRELEFLRREGYSTDLTYIPLTPDEARSFRLLFLDILTDGIRLFDRDSFFEKLSNQFLGRLSSLGAKKVKVGDDLWYWILKPDIKFGEKIQI
jgi:predicted nucleotidyltransferase